MTRGLGQAGAEQLGDLVAHRRRTGDERIGFANQPRFDGVHLAADRDRTPSPNACRPRWRGWWKPVGRRSIRRARSPGVRPASRARARRRAARADCGWSLRANPARTIEWPMASVQAIMSVPKSNSCGSCAAATTRTSSVISSVDGCVLGSVPLGRRLSTTTSWPAAASAVASWCTCRPSPPTTTGGYSHDTIRTFTRSLTPGRATAKCQQFAACRAQTRSLAGKGLIAAAAWRRARRTSPSARFQPSARRCACSLRPDASAPAISRVACACRCAR